MSEKTKFGALATLYSLLSLGGIIVIILMSTGTLDFAAPVTPVTPANDVPQPWVEPY